MIPCAATWEDTSIHTNKVDRGNPPAGTLYYKSRTHRCQNTLIKLNKSFPVCAFSRDSHTLIDIQPFFCEPAVFLTVYGQLKFGWELEGADILWYVCLFKNDIMNTYFMYIWSSAFTCRLHKDTLYKLLLIIKHQLQLQVFKSYFT